MFLVFLIDRCRQKNSKCRQNEFVDKLIDIKKIFDFFVDRKKNCRLICRHKNNCRLKKKETHKPNMRNKITTFVKIETMKSFNICIMPKSGLGRSVTIGIESILLRGDTKIE